MAIGSPGRSTPRSPSRRRAVRFLLITAALLCAGRTAGAAGFRPSTPTGDMPYIIVTTASLARSLQPLADWKTRTGLPAQIVTVEQIDADPGNPGSDLPEKIRIFLRNAHENWNTRWVLLGGHITEVPARGTFAVHGEHRAGGSIADLYYGDVLPAGGAGEGAEIYNWNSDGDGRFGENKDGMDLVSEMFVARLPFTDDGQVKDYLKKYFNYVNGKDGDYLGRALVVGADEFRASQESLSKMLLDLGGKSGYVVETQIEVPVQSIVDAMGKGHGIVDIFGHGCPNHMWLGEKRSHFGVTQIRTLVNKSKCGIVYSNGCSSNDYRQWESMGVAFLLNKSAGAVAYTGYTDASFQSPVSRTFYELVFTGEIPQISKALSQAKKKHLHDVWMNEYLNTLGEPEMWVYTAKPAKLTLEGSPVAGKPARIRVVSEDSKPLGNARVCVTQRGIYMTAVTDKDGWASLGAIEAPGKVQVMVMAQNHEPYSGTVQVGKAEGKVITAPKWVIDDDSQGESKGNGKGDLSPDETVELRLEWAQAPEKGTLKLTLAGAAVKVQRGELDASDRGGSFLVSVPGSARPGSQVWATVTLEVPGVEGAWAYRQVLPVQGPALRCVRIRVDDRKGNKDGRLGWEDAGGEVALHALVFNSGNQPAADCVLTLACDSPGVKLTQSEVSLGTVKPDDGIESRPFTFALDPEWNGDPLTLTLAMRDRDGGSWKATIRLEVPPAPPILLSHNAGVRHVNLSWRPGGSEGVDGYHIYRATRSGGPYKRLTEKPIKGMTVFRDAGVGPNDDYYYVVTSTTAEGLESVYSEELHARTPSLLWGKKR